MTAYLSNVCILHCGGERERHFIAYLENTLRTLQSMTFLLEYTTFQERQSKDAIMYNDAIRYKKQKLPMIVLISKYFFDMIWITQYKQRLLNVITNYSTENCLHIWLDVNESDVKRRSLSLCRTDGYFRRTNVADSANLTAEQVVMKLEEELNKDGIGTFKSMNNYSVDNDTEEMHGNWERALLGLKVPPTTAESRSADGPQKSTNKTRTRMKKNDPYKNALRMANMSREEIEAARLLDSPPDQATTGHHRTNTEHNNNTTKKKNKKKRKKKGEETTVVLLADITEKDRRAICGYLDQGSGENWRQLAEMFSMSPSVIEKLTNTSSSNNGSRTEDLIGYLKQVKPGLEVEEFGLRCKQIMRNDVQVYISDNILNQS